MSAPEVAVFWSYSHEDDELDGGAVVKLAQALRNEFALVTGEALTMFVDRDGIAWGDEWRRRIANALAETTFFIPIVTPRYFTRTECRRELLEFSSQAQSLGISELILPILYAKVREFSEANSDEAVVLVARMQYVDWTELRLRASTASEYRIAVNTLAIRLAGLAEGIAHKQLSSELKEVRNPEENELGISELLEELGRILPSWVEAIEAVQVDMAQSDATFQVYKDRIRKAEMSGPASAVFALLQRLASDEMPIAERSLTMAQAYASKTIELDPLVVRAARFWTEYSSSHTLFTELQSAIMAAHENIQKNDGLAKNPRYILAREWTAERAHTSRAMRKLSRLFSLYTDTVKEANEIVESWTEQFQRLSRVHRFCHDSFELFDKSPARLIVFHHLDWVGRPRAAK